MKIRLISLETYVNMGKYRQKHNPADADSFDLYVRMKFHEEAQPQTIFSTQMPSFHLLFRETIGGV